jgi:hypothetical protein
MTMRHDEVVEFLARLLQAGGTLTQKAGVWRIGERGEVINRSLVGRMMRAKYITGKRRGGLATVTSIGRRLARDSKAPPIGVELTYRLCKNHGKGRVVRATGTTALVIPSPAYRSNDAPAVLHVLSRPHGGAPWKGQTSTLGAYRNDPVLWPIIESTPGLLPNAWSAPLDAHMHSLARLHEVKRRLDSIGCRWDVVDVEEKAALAVPVPVPGNTSTDWALRYFRDNVQRFAGERDVLEYLNAVLANDIEVIAAAELARVDDLVARIMLNWWHDQHRNGTTIAERQALLEANMPLDELIAKVRAATGSVEERFAEQAHRTVVARVQAARKRIAR